MNPLLGIGLVLASTFAFTLMSALVRYLGQSVPIGEVVFTRSFFALIPLLLWMAWRGQLASGLRTSNPRAHFFRSAVGAFAMFLNFWALTLLPLADVTAIGFTMPLFSVVLAAIFLGEVVRVRRWTAVVVGLLGVLVMLWPHIGAQPRGDSSMFGALLALMGALVVAVAMTQVRHLSRTETTSSLVFYFSIVCTLAGLATLPWGWVVPTPWQLVLMIGSGFFGGMGQILITESYRHADASVVAPFSYSSMIYAVAIGYFWFSEVPQAIVLLGAAIVIAAGLFVIWREQRLGLDRTEERRAEGPPAGGPTV
ncbi:MAG: DMT family transporter [Bradyrhizobiaceae bacterium]|nr:DMT family transporter [Bradyrhizobiaceae bacterium]